MENIKELKIVTTTLQLVPEIHEPHDLTLTIDLTGEDIEALQESLIKNTIINKFELETNITVGDGIIRIDQETIYDIIKRGFEPHGSVISIEENNRYNLRISGANVIAKYLEHLTNISKIGCEVKFIPLLKGVSMVCKISVLTGTDVFGLESRSHTDLF